MAKKRKSTAGNGPSNDQHLPPSQPQFTDRDHLPSFSSTMPPRLKAPESPDIPRAMAATQPEQAEAKSSKKKKNKKRRLSSADEAAQPQTGADDEAEQQVLPTMEEKNVVLDVSPERKWKNKKKRQSKVQAEEQAEEQAEMEETLAEPVLQPKKKKKHRQSQVQEDEILAEPAPEPTQKKKKRHSELPSVEDVPIPQELAPVVDSTPGEKPKKKKKRHSEVAPVEEVHEEAIVDSSPALKPKKKKKRTSELPPVEDLPIHEDAVVDSTPVPKPKKKKRHSEIPPAEELPVHEEAVVDSTPVLKPKQKKKKHTSELPPVEDLPIHEDAVVDSTPVPKPKKKKRHSEIPPAEELPVHEEAVVDSTPVLKPKKKKKNRTSELAPIEELLIFEEEVVDPTPAQHSKKKKKKRTSELPPVEELPIQEDAVVDSTPAQGLKKKKKRTSELPPVEEHVVPEEPTQEDETVIEPSTERNRKKKKKKHSEAPLGDETLVHDMLLFQAVVQATQVEEVPVQVSPERKRKKKKRHSGSEEAQLTEEIPAEEIPALEEAIEASPEKKKKKKKSKRQSVSEDQLPEESVPGPSQEEEAIPEASSEPKSKKKRHSEVLDVDQSHVESSSKSERKKKKKQLAQSDVQPSEDNTPPEDYPVARPASPPASPLAKSSKKKRSRTEDPDQEPATAKKSRKHAPPPEADELYANRPFLLASHLDGDTSAVASLWEQRLARQQTVSATQPNPLLDGDCVWPPVERESPVRRGDSGPSRRREESIETASEAEDRGQPQDGEDDKNIYSLSPKSPFETDEIESVASDEEGRPLGNRGPSIESDSDRPVSPSPEPAHAGFSNVPQGTADIEMYDAESDFDSTRHPDEEEVSATPYPEPEISSTATSTHSRSSSHQETETPPPQSEDMHQQASPTTTEDSQPILDSVNGQLNEDVAQSPSPEPVLSARAKGKRRVGKFDQGSEMLQDQAGEAQPVSERATDVLDVEDDMDDTPAAASSPAPKPPKTPKSRMATARKPKTPFFEQGEVEKEKAAESANAQAFAELPGPEVAAPITKRPRGRPKTIKDDVKPKPEPKPQVVGKDGFIKGAMSPEERQALRTAAKTFWENEELTEDEFKNLIHGTPTDWKKEDRNFALWHRLWPHILEACPGRNRKFVITRTRLEFHNYVARGVWTKEQDVELFELIKKYKTKTGAEWVKIGKIINRLPEDCREHWRNYLSYGDDRNTDYWTEDQEQQLYEAVQTAVNKIKAKMDWSEICDKRVMEVVDWWELALSPDGMNKTRDRIQCQKKWKQLRERGLIHDEVASVMLAGEAWRAIRTDVKAIKVDDKLKMAKAIADSDVVEDSRIPWKKIKADVFGNRPFQLKAIEVVWGSLRRGIPGEKDMTSRECAKYICDTFDRDGVIVEPGMTEDDILDEAELPEESASPAEGESASPAVAIADANRRIYRKARVKPEPAESRTMASIPQKPKTATKAAPRKPSAKAATKASTSTKKAARSEEFAHDSDSDEDEVPESVQEEVPESPQPEVPESPQEDVSAAPRDPSIDLGHDTSPAPAPRTSSARKKTVAKRTVIVDSDEEDAPPAPEPSPVKTMRPLKRKPAVIDSDSDEEDVPPAPEPSPVKRIRSLKRKPAVIPDEDEEEDVKPPREELPAPPSSKKRTYKRNRTFVEEEEPEVRPLAFEAKRRKTRVPPVGDWEAPVGVPLRAMSVVSSDMDDMEDIQATLPF